MGDWIKIALKAGLVIVFMGAIWALWTQLPVFVPTIAPEFWNFIGQLKAILEYYIPGFGVFFTFCMGAIGVRVAGALFKIVSNVGKWLYQIFE